MVALASVCCYDSFVTKTIHCCQHNVTWLLLLWFPVCLHFLLANQTLSYGPFVNETTCRTFGLFRKVLLGSVFVVVPLKKGVLYFIDHFTSFLDSIGSKQPLDKKSIAYKDWRKLTACQKLKEIS